MHDMVIQEAIGLVNSRPASAYTDVRRLQHAAEAGLQRRRSACHAVHEEVAVCQQALGHLTTLSLCPSPTESECWSLPLPEAGIDALPSVNGRWGSC